MNVVEDRPRKKSKSNTSAAVPTANANQANACAVPVIAIPGPTRPVNKTAKPPRAKSSRKTSEAQSWTDIFSQFKLVLSLCPRDRQGPQILIRHAQPEFYSNFKFTASSLPLPLQALFGKATIRFSTIKLQNAMLRRTDPVEPRTTIPSREKWAVLTVRSASLVGNSKLNGIGLLGIQKISSETLHKRPETQRSLKEKEKEKEKERLREKAREKEMDKDKDKSASVRVE